MTARLRMIEEFDRIADAVGQLASDQPVATTLERLTSEASQAAGAHRAALLLVRPESDHFHMIARVGIDADQEELLLEEARGQGACARSVQRCEAILVTDTENDPLVAPWRDRLLSANIRAQMVAPVVERQGTVLGVLVCYFDHPHVPTAQDLERNRLFAQLAALALEHDRLLSAARRRLDENQRLYSAEQEARRAAECAAEHLSVLADASLLLDASLDVDATLDGVVRLVVPRLADHACIYPARFSSEIQVLASGNARVTDAIATGGSPSEQGSVDSDHDAPGFEEAVCNVLEEGTARLVDPEEPEGGRHLLVPLIAQRRTLGLLHLARNGSRRPWTVEDVATAEELGRRAGSALNSARLHQTTEASALRLALLSRAAHAFEEAGLDLGAVLGGLANAVGSLLGDGCGIRVFGPGVERLVPKSLHLGGGSAADEVERLLTDETTASWLQERLDHLRGPLCWPPPELSREYGVRESDNDSAASASRPFGKLATSFSEALPSPSRAPDVDGDVDVEVEVDARSSIPPHGTVPEALTDNVAGLLGVPLQTRGEVIGSLIAIRLAGSAPYSQADATLLEEIAARASLALENAQLYAAEYEARVQSEQATERLRAVQSVADAALGGLDLDTLLPTLLSRVCHELRAETATVLLREDDLLVVRASHGRADDTRGVTISVGDGLSGKVAATGEAAVVEDLDTVQLATPALKGQVRSLLAVPLLSDSGVLGVVHVGTADPRRFGENDLNLLRLLAERVARAVERARLYSAEQQARSTAERTARRLARLAELTSSLDRALTEAQVARVLAEQGVDASGANAAVVAMVDAQGQLGITASVGYPDEVLSKYERLSPKARLPLAMVGRTGKPLWLENATETARRFPRLAGTIERLHLRSFAILPLHVEGRVLGAIDLAFDRPRVFDEEEKSFLLTLAGQCAQAFERARLYDVERRERADAETARQRLVLLAEASRALAATRSPREIVTSFERLVSPAFADHCQVTIGPPPRKSSPRNATQESSLSECGTEIVTDLHIGGQQLGKLTLVRGSSARFTPEDASLSRELAVRLSLALGNIRLLEEARRAERQSRAHAVRLRGLAEASREFASAGVELQRVQDAVCQWVTREISDACELRLLSDDGNTLHRSAHHHRDRRAMALLTSIETSPQSADHGAHARVLRRNRSMLVPHVRTEKLITDLDPAFLPFVDRYPITSAVVVPLRSKDKVLGTLAAYRHAKDHPFTRADLLFLEELADRAVLGIENARLYKEIRQAVQVRDEFLSVAGHELRTPLTTLQLQVQALQALSNAPERASRRLNSAVRQVERLTRLVQELLDVSRITAGRLTFHLEQVEIGGLVSEVVSRFGDELLRASTRIDLQLTDEIHGQWDRLRVEQVITNLLSNAVKYGAEKPIEVRVERDGDMARLVVRDQGIGIADEDVARIFDRFERAVSPRHYGGLGLGLWISRQIVEASGGVIRVRSKPLEGSTFIVELPCLPPPPALESRNDQETGTSERARHRG